MQNGEILLHLQQARIGVIHQMKTEYFTGYRRYQVVSNCLSAGCSAVLSGGMFHGWVGGHGDCGAGGVQVHDLG